MCDTSQTHPYSCLSIAATPTRDQLVLDHPSAPAIGGRSKTCRQHTYLWCRRQIRAAPSTGRARAADARPPTPGLRSLLRRSDFGADLANGGGDDGGFDEFRLFGPAAASTRHLRSTAFRRSPATVQSAQPAAQPMQQDPHRTDVDRQTPHHDRQSNTRSTCHADEHVPSYQPKRALPLLSKTNLQAH